MAALASIRDHMDLILASLSLQSAVVFIMTATVMDNFALYTLPAVDRLTQPPTLYGAVK